MLPRSLIKYSQAKPLQSWKSCHLTVKLATSQAVNVSTRSSRHFHIASNIRQQELTKDSPSIQKVTESAEEEELPWYMRAEESPIISSPLNTAEIPEIPSDAPASLTHVLTFIAEKLSVSDLKLFDMRDSEEYQNGAGDLADFMIIGTGKSAKHLQKAADELNFFIKHELKSVPYTEGIVKAATLNRYLRRLKKKGKKPSSYANNNYGSAPNTWVMVDAKADGIFVHILTPERREELDLERLWDPESAEPQAATPTKPNDDIFAGVRYYHTSARRLAPETGVIMPFDDEFNVYTSTKEEWNQRFAKLREAHMEDPQKYPFVLLEENLAYMSACGYRMDSDDFIKFVTVVLESPEINKNGMDLGTLFNRRFSHIREVVEHYHPKLTKKNTSTLSKDDAEIVGGKIIPLLIAAGSAMEQPGFIKPSDLDRMEADGELEHKHKEKVYIKSRLVSKLKDFSQEVSDKMNPFRLQQTFLDTLFLSVAANERSWNSFNSITNDALLRQDFTVVKLAAQYTAFSKSPDQCYHFLTSFVPFLFLEKEVFPEFIPYIKTMIDTCDPGKESLSVFRNMIRG